ncbi:MAG: PGF-CTERM sorting domain-containing protein [Methanophagales archaeon]|nr:PGF-CTERM sorting domain-containing protein [Methanophagales archaeon]
MGKYCDCWVIEGQNITTYAEKNTGITVKEVYEGAGYNSTSTLIDTNIPDFPPPISTETPTPKQPGFEAALAIVGLIIVVSYLAKRRKKWKTN